MAAVRSLFPSPQVYLCGFHREQAWERWVKERRHGLNDITIKDGVVLRMCCGLTFTLIVRFFDRYYVATIPKSRIEL